MMADVDALNRFYEPGLAQHLKIAAILRKEYVNIRPLAYASVNFTERKMAVKIGKNSAKN